MRPARLSTRRIVVRLFVLLQIAGLSAAVAVAQNYNGDARSIAMGGLMEHGNAAAGIAHNSEPYSTFVLPLGLVQVLRNHSVFDPTSPSFDPIQSVERVASPLHFTINRDDGDSQMQLIHDLVNGDVSRDLNAYHGFAPQPTYNATGLINPGWGPTIRVHGKKNTGSYHGIFVGVGPYLSLGTNAAFDQGLINILTSPTPVYTPNAHFLVQDTTNGQAAAALTVGYRGHFQPGHAMSGTPRDGVYLAVNYDYLRGYHYDVANLNIRFDTDSNGLLSLAPTTTPIVALHQWATKGTGDAVDLSTVVVINHIEARFSADGIGNHIDWQNFQARQYVLASLTQGLKFSTLSAVAPTGTLRVELPVRYTVGGAYITKRWDVDSGYSRGIDRNEFHAGGEYHLSRIDLRGGARYARAMWEPAGGVGLNLTKHFAVDFAAFGTATNIEQVRKTTLALSLRFNKGT